MRFVIFDDETMEPVTVVNLPGVTERDIWERMDGQIRIPLSPEDRVPRMAAPEEVPIPTKMYYVLLRFERFVRRGQTHLICVTRETELAMLLDPDFLPGQRKLVTDLRIENDRLARLILSVISGDLS